MTKEEKHPITAMAVFDDGDAVRWRVTVQADTFDDLAKQMQKLKEFRQKIAPSGGWVRD